MYALKITTTTILFFVGFLSVKAQYSDLPAGQGGSTSQTFIQSNTLTRIINSDRAVNKKTISVKSLIVPGAMITYGFISIGNNNLKNVNKEFHEDIWIDKPHQSKHIDNYLMFAPALSVYGLNAMGIKGKNNLRDRTMIYLLSTVIQNTTVFAIKKLSGQLRPDGTNYNSFPSGHTQVMLTVAMIATMIWPKGRYFWFSVSLFLGFTRVVIHQHFFSDFVGGAFLGIYGTLWIYQLWPPKIN